MSAYREDPARAYCLVVGAVLVAVGVVGFLWNASFQAAPPERDALLGIFDINGWHNLVHIATGAVSLAVAGNAAAARTWLLIFGVTYIAVTIWGFAIGNGGSILGIIPVNTADNFLHLFLGASALGVYAMTGAERPTAARA
jgi:hypothetical protein